MVSVAKWIASYAVFDFESEIGTVILYLSVYQKQINASSFAPALFATRRAVLTMHAWRVATNSVSL